MIFLTAYVLTTFLSAKGEAISVLTVKNYNLHEHANDDGWGEWSEWHNCSRTCGGGVTFMKRECRVSSGACEGPSKMYASCSITDCPVDAQDFRSLQCAHHNNITYRGQMHEWIPYEREGAANACALFCQPKSGEFHLKMSDRVIDGTRCSSGGRFDVCVDGACEVIGCDLLLGSNLKLDVCGECGGDGTSCRLVKRSVTAKLPTGYVPLIFIPPGATQVHVWEKKASKNFLAVRDSGKRYVLNGHWQTNSSSVVRVAGSNLVYTKTGNRKKAQESIKIEGPTSEMIYIDVLVQDRNRGIEYEFYIPRGLQDVNYSENQWFTEPWQRCTAECGGGLQKRKVVCKNNNSGERVLNYICYTRERPQSTRTCNTQPCAARWLVGEWEACTRQCDGGVQTRPVNCVQNRGDSNGLPILLPRDECIDLVRPDSQRECGTGACPEWNTGDWSECSSTCGVGHQRRNVVCSAESSCDATSAPSRERRCNLGPCSKIAWVTTDWSECVGSCGNGVQTREVVCETEDKIRYPESLCNASEQPSSIRRCESELLCPVTPAWIVEGWSECSVSCGSGFQTRRVVCGLYEVKSYRVLPDDDCSHRGRSPKSPTTRQCFVSNCTQEWYTGTWGPCSASCGNGLRSRVVLCVGESDDVLDDETCVAATRPADLESCNEMICETAVGETSHRPESCRGSTYGCCPDGVTEARGENGMGCPEVFSPIVKTVESTGVDDKENCHLEQDAGDCNHWVVFWYYDVETGRCDRFWYGGCGGNGNRFQSARDCARVCSNVATQQLSNEATSAVIARSTEKPAVANTVIAQPTATSGIITTRALRTSDSIDLGLEVLSPTPHTIPPLCYLRKSAGPCNSSVRRWFYDGSAGRCAVFLYGGCGGNENNFASQETCAQICGDEKISIVGNGAKGDLPNSLPVPVRIRPGRAEVRTISGEMTRLACMAEGSPKPSVTWRKVGNGDRGVADRGEILEDHSLLLSIVEAEDQGTYECTASNGYGPEQTWRVELIVKDRLLIKEAPMNASVHVGEPAELRCRIHEDVIFVTWEKDGEKVQSDEYYVTQPWGDLHILQAEQTDSGVYTCTAYTTTDAWQSASAELIVSQKEQITTPSVASKLRKPSLTKQCKDYPEYANCNIVVLKRMCHKHGYARYCCASCGGKSTQPPRRRSGFSRRHNTKR